MSLVDVTKPTSPIALTEDMRNNFRIIKQELEILQTFMNSGVIADSPIFTGDAEFNSAHVNGTLRANIFIPNSETPISSQSPTLAPSGQITVIGNLGSGPAFTLTKSALGIVHLSGFTSFTTNVMAAEQTIAGVGAVDAAYRPTQNIHLILSSGTDDAVWRIAIWADGRIKLMKLVGALPDTATHSLYWAGSYRVA